MFEAGGDAYICIGTTAAGLLPHPTAVECITDQDVRVDMDKPIHTWWASRLWALNIRIEYLERSRNCIANGLSRTIFPGETRL